ncbi:MAG: urease accessory protein UreD [Ilumatobacteraceae bacterium]|nr:urease accessory protein UreD [Ilumatobacteraceae bacterium]
MHASGELVVALDGRGRSVAHTICGEAPLLMRVTGHDPLTVHLVGGAAGPLGGDALRMRVDVGEGAQLHVRSVAATLAQPGPHGTASVTCTDAHAAAGATLDWWPEPLVAVAGCDHTVRTRVVAAAGSDVRWVDEVVGGRHDAPAGTVVLHQRVELDGVPVLHHTVRPSWPATATADPTAPAARAGRVLVSAVWLGPPSCRSLTLLDAGVRAGRFALGANATAWVGVGADLDVVRAALCELDLRR